MRRERASAYQRQFLNEFASSSSQFVDLHQWDKCVDQRLGRIGSDPSLPVWVGIDVGFKHDATGIAVLSHDRKTNLVRLCTHYIFQPSPDQPLNFEQTLEQTLLDLNKRYQLRKCLFDP
jgi:phage terminase large subunit-like protein